MNQPNVQQTQQWEAQQQDREHGFQMHQGQFGHFYPQQYHQQYYQQYPQFIHQHHHFHHYGPFQQY